MHTTERRLNPFNQNDTPIDGQSMNGYAPVEPADNSQYAPNTMFSVKMERQEQGGMPGQGHDAAPADELCRRDLPDRPGAGAFTMGPGSVIGHAPMGGPSRPDTGTFQHTTHVADDYMDPNTQSAMDGTPSAHSRSQNQGILVNGGGAVDRRSSASRSPQKNYVAFGAPPNVPHGRADNPYQASASPLRPSHTTEPRQRSTSGDRKLSNLGKSGTTRGEPSTLKKSRGGRGEAYGEEDDYGEDEDDDYYGEESYSASKSRGYGKSRGVRGEEEGDAGELEESSYAIQKQIARQT